MTRPLLMCSKTDGSEATGGANAARRRWHWLKANFGDRKRSEEAPTAPLQWSHFIEPEVNSGKDFQCNHLVLFVDEIFTPSG